MTRRQRETNPEMGARGKARREELGLRIIDLALALDLSTPRIHQMEQDGVDGLALIGAWAKALQMDPQTLIFGDPAPKKKASKR